MVVFLCAKDSIVCISSRFFKKGMSQTFHFNIISIEIQTVRDKHRCFTYEKRYYRKLSQLVFTIYQYHKQSNLIVYVIRIYGVILSNSVFKHH